MAELNATITIIKAVEIILSLIVIPITIAIFRLIEGMKCQLRTEMLRTYYHNKDSKKIRQYEKENFVHLYNAYKALWGNTFIDDVYEEVRTWEVIS